MEISFSSVVSINEFANVKLVIIMFDRYVRGRVKPTKHPKFYVVKCNECDVPGVHKMYSSILNTKKEFNNLRNGLIIMTYKGIVGGVLGFYKEFPSMFHHGIPFKENESWLGLFKRMVHNATTSTREQFKNIDRKHLQDIKIHIKEAKMHEHH